MNDVLRVGTRTSPLALWQTRAVCDGLAKAGIKTEIVKISSLGDRSLGGDLSTALGQFVDAVDQALISGEVDLAVHSMKDVPVEHMQGIELVSVLPRFPVEDLLLHQGEGQTLAEVLSQRGDGTVLSMSASEVFSGFSKRAKFGSVASRRQAFALSLRPDIQPISVRGKVETRLLRLAQGWVDYLPLAEAGLLRLFEDGLLDDWMLELKAIRLDSSEWPCAPSQGAIAVHAKQDSLSEQVRLALEEHLTCSNTMSDVAKERDILQQLGGGCTYPAGVWCDDGMIHLKVAEEGWRAKASRKQACQTIDWQGDFADYSSIADSLQIPASEATSQSNPDAIKILSTSTSERLHYQILGDSRFSLTQHSGIELSTTDLDWQDFAP